MRIGIYPAALYVCGGGEKYIGKVAEILSRANNVSFITFDKPDLDKLHERLNLDLSRVAVDRLTRPLWLRAARHWHGIRIADLVDARLISNKTRGLDLFINQEHQSFIPSFAKRSILLCEVPPKPSLTRDNTLTRILLDPKSRRYNTIVTNSQFTKKWADAYYGREAMVLNPPVDLAFFSPSAKEKIILSVGRFSTSLHSKKQVEMIRAFKTMWSHEPATGWEYHLVGGVGTQSYLDACRAEATGYPIRFHTDASFDTLRALYGKARIFWHATGLSDNENEHPERMEHFGITTVEAMSAGCVPVVIAKGGQPEIVEHKVTGFLFDTVNELIAHSARLMNDGILWQKMSQACRKESLRFGMEAFESRVRALLETQDGRCPPQ